MNEENENTNNQENVIGPRMREESNQNENENGMEDEENGNFQWESMVDLNDPISLFKFFQMRNAYFREREKPFKEWEEPKTIEEKRKLYECGNKYIPFSDIKKWDDYAKEKKLPKARKQDLKYEQNQKINNKISLIQCDITHLEIDAIVNAANSSLYGGGGIDGAIHDAAGDRYLRHEAQKLYPDGCKTGQSVKTRGFKLPAKSIIHTVGPTDEDPKDLQSCYETTLDLVLKNNIKTVAFCCVGTGIYSFPLRKATHIALDVTRKFLENHADKVDRIIFCVYLDKECRTYERYIPYYFPRVLAKDEEVEEQGEEEPETPKPKWSFVWGDSDDDDEDDFLMQRINQFDEDDDDDEFVDDEDEELEDKKEDEEADKNEENNKEEKKQEE